MKKLLMVVLMSLAASNALAYETAYEIWTDPDTEITWAYNIQGDGSASLGINRGYYTAVSRDTMGDLTIPSNINGKSVTSIGDMAFEDCLGLTSVTIPSSVTSIGLGAFRDCRGLMSVTIPSSVTNIGNSAFEGCSGLTSVTIPSSVTSIGDGVFSWCSKLTSVTIPSSVTSIGNNAFWCCSGLRSVAMPEGVTNIGRGAFFNCSGLTSVTIPEGVTSIGDYAFSECSGLADSEGFVIVLGVLYDYFGSESSVTIPSSVTSIGDDAFSGCDGLTSVTIPSSVTSIGDGVFSGCDGLTSVTIPSSVTSIGSYAFYNCYGLKSVTIPPSVTSIGNFAFSGCSGLTSVTISEGVASVGDRMFYNCDGLTSVTIPSSVTSIGYMAFEDCSGLTDVTICEGVTCIWDCAFRGCRGLTSVAIPSSVTRIWDYAFSGCDALKTIIVGLGDADRVKELLTVSGLDVSGVSFVVEDGGPYTEVVDGIEWTFVINAGTAEVRASSASAGAIAIPSMLGGCRVASIGAKAFYGCSGLASVSIPSSVTSIGWIAFGYCSGLTNLSLSSGIKTIDGNAFLECDNLESVHIDSLLAFGAVDFENEYSNPMYYADKLYANGELVTGAAKVEFRSGDIACFVEPDESGSAFVYPDSKTTEVQVGRPAVPPDTLKIYDARFAFDRWSINPYCILGDCVLTPVYKGAEINEVLRDYLDPYGTWVVYGESHPEVYEEKVDSKCQIDRIVYDASSGCIRAQGTVDESDSPLADMDDIYQGGAYDERLFENLRIRLIGRDEQGSQVCQVDLPRHCPTSGFGFTWSGALQVDTNIVRQIDVALASTWYEGEYVLRQIPVSDIDCRRLVVRKMDLADLRGADYELVEEKTEHHYHDYSTRREDTVTYFDFQRELKGEKCEAVYEFSDRDGLYNSCFISYATINGVLADLSSGGFTWVTAYDSTSCASNVITLYYSDDFTSREEWQGTRRVELRNWSEETYATTITVAPRKYTAQFDLDGCGVRIGGGELIQKIDSDKDECEEFPIIEANPHCTFLRWAQPYWNGNTLVYVAEYDREYVITYEDVKGVANPNPTTYTVTNEIVFAALADTDEYWFKGWEPARIEVGTTGDLVVTAKWDRVQGVAEAGGDVNREWTTDGDADWFVVWNEAKGKYVVRSGEIGDDQSSVLETVVVNAGIVSFSVSTSCEEAYRGKIRTDGLSFSIDGNEVLWLDGETSWTNILWTVTGEGEHRLQWRFCKDMEGESGEDCARLTGFTFYHEVVVSFMGGGAEEGEVPAAISSYNGAEITLPSIGMLRYPKHAFVGWSDGTKVYQPGETFLLGDVAPVFTAQWSVKQLLAPVISVESVYATERTEVSISAESGATIRYTMDGSDPTESSPTYGGPFEIAGSMTIKAAAFRDDWFDSPIASASTVRIPWTYGECLNSEELDYSSVGTGKWVRDLSVVHDGVAALRSGEIGNSETSRIELRVSGGGELSFWWKASTEVYRNVPMDSGVLVVDGQDVAEIYGEADWVHKTIVLSGGGTHVVRWEFRKDEEDDPLAVGDDCVWLDEVVWTPAGPSVANDPGAVVTGDAESGYVIVPSADLEQVEIEL